MPMIDVYATAGTFTDQHQLATDLATAVMTIEQVPDIPMFRQNTAAFIHDLPAGDLANVDGETNYVRIQVLTNAGALDRGKQLAVVERLTDIAAKAAGDPALATGPGCCSPRHQTGAGASVATRTPTMNWWPPPARRSRACEQASQEDEMKLTPATRHGRIRLAVVAAAALLVPASRITAAAPGIAWKRRDDAAACELPGGGACR